MPRYACLIQHIVDRTGVSQRVLQADFCFTGNGIDCHEAKALDLTELEWIRFHDSQTAISELFSDHRNLFHRNTERRQVYHEIAQGLRFPVRFDDCLEFFLGNPLDAKQLVRLFLQNLHCLIAKASNNGLCGLRANSLDDTAAQVSKDAGLISRHDFLTH